MRQPSRAAEPTLLLLHGFPESSFSFHKVVEGLAKLFDRVVLFDFLRYGLSDKPRTNYTSTPIRCASRPMSRWRCGESSM